MGVDDWYPDDMPDVTNCPRCEGTGRIYDEEDCECACPVCLGSGKKCAWIVD